MVVKRLALFYRATTAAGVTEPGASRAALLGIQPRQPANADGQLFQIVSTGAYRQLARSPMHATACPASGGIEAYDG